MSLLWFDGFDWYTNDWDLAKTWDYIHSDCDASSSYSRRSGVGKGMRYGWGGIKAWRYVTASNPIIVGGAFWANATLDGAAYGPFALCGDGGAWHVHVRVSATGEVVVYRGNGTAELGRTAPNTFPAFTWRYLEIKAYIHDSAGYVIVKLDGATVLNLTSKDTRNGGGVGQVDQIILGPLTGGWTWVDDLYVLNTNGDAPLNDFLGPVFVDYVYPAGAGNYSEFTKSGTGGSNYDRVDDPGGPDGDTTYVYATVDGKKDSYNLTNLPVNVSSGDPLAVKEILQARKEPGVAQSITPMVRSGGVDYFGDEKILAESFICAFKIWDADPAGGAWTVTSIDNAEFGMQYNQTTTTTAPPVTTTTSA